MWPSIYEGAVDSCRCICCVVSVSFYMKDNICDDVVWRVSVMRRRDVDSWRQDLVKACRVHESSGGLQVFKSDDLSFSSPMQHWYWSFTSVQGFIRI